MIDEEFCDQYKDEIIEMNTENNYETTRNDSDDVNQLECACKSSQEELYFSFLNEGTRSSQIAETPIS